MVMPVPAVQVLEREHATIQQLVVQLRQYCPEIADMIWASNSERGHPHECVIELVGEIKKRVEDLQLK